MAHKARGCRSDTRISSINNKAMNTENIYQVLDDLETFANNIGSEWMKERVAMLEAQIANLENQSTL